MRPRSRLLGIVSDTHGKLDEKILDLFAGVERIIHAGDIGGDELIWKLAANLAQSKPLVYISAQQTQNAKIRSESRQRPFDDNLERLSTLVTNENRLPSRQHVSDRRPTACRPAVVPE